MWVLIIILYGSSDGGKALDTSQRFSYATECQVAADKIMALNAHPTMPLAVTATCIGVR